MIALDHPDQTSQQYSITQVANMLEIPQHVLRMWESQFNTIRPERTQNGRRTYSPATITAIRNVQSLLHEEGLSLEEAKQRLEGTPAPARLQPSAVQENIPGIPTTADIMPQLRTVLAALETAQAALTRQ